MIGFLVRGRVRIKIRFRVRVRVRVGVTFNINIYHRSNCRRSKCRTFTNIESTNVDWHISDNGELTIIENHEISTRRAS